VGAVGGPPHAPTSASPTEASSISANAIGRATDPPMAQEPRKARTEGQPGRVHDDDDKGERDELDARIRAAMTRNQGAGSTVTRAIALADHSHSIVPGGLDVTS